MTMIQESSHAFNEILTNNAMFAAIGRSLGQPELKLKLDRKFRRSL